MGNRFSGRWRKTLGALCLALSAVGAQAANYLTFTAVEANSSVTFSYTYEESVQYSMDGGETWKNYNDSTEIKLLKVGDKVSFKGRSVTTADGQNFSMTGKIAASGDVTSLTNETGGDAELGNSCYASMFSGCEALTSAPALPATTLAQSCYQKMFAGCTALTSAPALPATNLAQSCYHGMFHGCTSLTSTPTLPATTLAKYCYREMFRGCTSLTSAPTLPATTLADNCYQSMFYDCTSLEVNTTPSGKELKIPVESTAAQNWGKDMFKNIKSGSTVPTLPAQNTTYYIASAPGIDLGDGMHAYDQGNGTYSVNGIGMLTKERAALIKDQGITNLVVGAGVEGVGANAFEGWWLLRDVTLGADCTSVGERAFKKCYGLTNVVSRVEGSATVGDYAFAGCHSLQALNFGEDGKPEFGEGAFTFKTVIYMRDGIPEIYPVPELTMANYDAKKLGSNDLKNWTEVSEETMKDYHFFKFTLVPTK